MIESVRVIEPDGSVVDLARDECSPSYRNANLGGRIVLGVVLRFEPAPKAQISDRMKEYLLAKNQVQPVTDWSAGCVFKNPDPELSMGRSAGKLVEDAGGKELRRGDAIVSPLHGNFIVNTRAATAEDVFGLISDLRQLVLDRTGVALELEVKRWQAPAEV